MAEHMDAALLLQRWATMTEPIDVLPFYTEHGQHGVFSNFAPTPFSFELPMALLSGGGTSPAGAGAAQELPHGFRSPVACEWSEQAIMLTKAAMFRDARAYSAIASARSAAEAKRIGRAVRAFDDRHWDSMVCAVATEVVRQKFSKAEGCAAKLRATGTRLLAEASESDRIWGIGVRWNDPRCTVPAQWRGSNILGYALMQVRDGLGALSANEAARQAALTLEDQRLQTQARSQVHVEKAPPKHSLAAMASTGTRRERQQDNVMVRNATFCAIYI